MRKILFLLAMLIGYFCISSCNMLNMNDSYNTNDSIPLNFVDLIPDTSWIDIDDDDIIDIILLDTAKLYYQGEPHNLYIRALYAKSTNKDIQISYGGALQNGEKYLLEKGLVVDNSLIWVSEFVIGSSGPYMPEKLNPEYIGIKFVKNSHTFFGWIHKPGYFSEFAIDSSKTNIDKVILAGKKKK